MVTSDVARSEQVMVMVGAMRCAQEKGQRLALAWEERAGAF
ncbi:hypothetical protein [Delftia acidovorans]|nr:hypothetical protein [Delftia acidovorans]